MLLTKKEIKALEFHFDYNHTLSDHVTVFPEVGEDRLEQPAEVRLYSVFGYSFMCALNELPKLIQEKIYRHVEM